MFYRYLTILFLPQILFLTYSKELYRVFQKREMFNLEVILFILFAIVLIFISLGSIFKSIQKDWLCIILKHCETKIKCTSRCFLKKCIELFIA